MTAPNPSPEFPSSALLKTPPHESHTEFVPHMRANLKALGYPEQDQDPSVVPVDPEVAAITRPLGADALSQTVSAIDKIAPVK